MINGDKFTSLKDCSFIRTGQTFKKPLDEYPKGNVAILLPKNIMNGALIEEPIYINENEVPSLQKHLLKKGEILIINKGLKFNTFLFNGTPSEAVATTAFYIITPGETIIPEYLFWYLNQKETKEYFSSGTTGSVIPTITKDVLSSLLVPIIPLEKQSRLCEFIKEATTEQLLLKDLIKKKNELMESYIWEQIQQYL